MKIKISDRNILDIIQCEYYAIMENINENTLNNLKRMDESYTICLYLEKITKNKRAKIFETFEDSEEYVKMEDRLDNFTVQDYTSYFENMFEKFITK